MSSTPPSWYRIENAASPEAADVHIYDEISHFGILADDFRKELAGVSAPRIRLHLNSPGGYVDDGIAIYNNLKDHPSAVDVYIEGVAASIASVIAMAGERVVIAPHARMMIHNARVFSEGDDEDYAKMSARLADTNRNIASIYVERAGGEVDEWLARMKATTWYTDQGAVDAGLADEIGRSNDDQRAAAIAARQIAQFQLLSKYPDGDRMVARLVTELAHGDVLPDEPEADADDAPIEHACACGGGDDCPLVVRAQAPSEPESINDEIVREQEELEAALASVRPQEVYRWL